MKLATSKKSLETKYELGAKKLQQFTELQNNPLIAELNSGVVGRASYLRDSAGTRNSKVPTTGDSVLASKENEARETCRT